MRTFYAREISIGLDDRFVEELRRLLCPDTCAGFMEDIHQGVDIGLGETPAEISACSGTRDPLGSQDIEIDFIVARRFEVFDGSPSSSTRPLPTFTPVWVATGNSRVRTTTSA